MFKRKLKNRVDQKFNNLIEDPDFIKPSVKVTPTFNFKRMIPALSVSLGCLLVGGIVLGAVIRGRTVIPPADTQDAQNNNGVGPVRKLKPFYQKGLRLENEIEVVKEFEKNAQFVFGGDVTTFDEHGELVEINDSEIEVDSSKFNEGVEGTYEIECELKTDAQVNVSYDVTVNDEEIETIRIRSYKNRYYRGEVPIKDDIDVYKIMKSGREKLALPTEFDMDIGNFDIDFFNGDQTVTVSLLTNPDIKETYSVSNLPLEYIELIGDYAYIDDCYRVGEPVIKAFTVGARKITSDYCDVVCEGTYNKTINDGKAYLSVPDCSQVMCYDPTTRIMTVPGLVPGDADLYCSLITEKDVYVRTNKTNTWLDEYLLVAKNGYLDKKTLDYLEFVYGGVYLDSTFKNPVNYDHRFKLTDCIYLGVRQEPINDKSFIGKWYCKERMNQVIFEITEEAFITYDGETNKYSAVEYEDVIILRLSGEIFEYEKQTKKMYYVESADGLRTVTYTQYNPKKQAIVTILTGNVSYDIVYEAGDSINRSFYTENCVYNVTADHTEENDIVANGMTARVHIVTDNLGDYQGNYGTDYLDYWRITGFRGTETIWNWYTYHENYLVHIQNGVIVQRGWIEMYENNKTGALATPPLPDPGLASYNHLAKVHFEDNTEMIIKLGYDAIDMGNGAISKNDLIWNTLEAATSYDSTDKTKKIVLGDGWLAFYEANENSEMKWQISYDAFVKSVTDDKVVIRINVFDDLACTFEIKEIELTKDESGYYSFDYEGVHYVKHVVQ